VLILVIIAGYYLLVKNGAQPIREDLLKVAEGAPPAPFGFPTMYAAFLAYSLGLVNVADIHSEIPVPEGVVEKKDIEYGNVGERRLLLNLYSPQNLENPAPGLIFIHGGGWTSGDRNDYKYYTVRFAKRGYVVATISYRFAQEAGFPGCVEDTKCAVRWMRANAAELKVDPDKIAVIGGSAGGYLALMAGYTADRPELEGQGGWPGVSSKVAAVVDLYGPVDLTVDYAREHPTITGFLKKSYTGNPELYTLASPIAHVTPNSPPTLIFQGSIDHLVPVKQSDALALKLIENGVPYWYDCLYGMPHTMDIIIPVNERCQYIMNAFFEKFMMGKPVEEMQPEPRSIMGAVEKKLSKISDFAWGPPMLILLMGTHIFLTIRLRFIQRFVGKAIRLSLARTREGSGEISHFGALTTALAATVGTGNIVGVATAIAAGGPGAVLWMWLTGVFGIATKYAEALLAVKYRVTRPDGTVAGGPMYALERGLNAKWLGVLFAAFTAVAAFGIGNMVQANALASVLHDSKLEVNPWISGVIMTVLVAVVVIGGIKSIARVSEKLVPLMAVLYVFGCVVLLIIGIGTLPATIVLIIKSAFTGHAAVGGFLGAGVRAAMRYGIARGLFSNESGLGSAPIVAAAAQTKNPVRQALVSSTGTFWDTVVICLMTGLVIVNSGEWQSGLKGAALTHQAFSDFTHVGPLILTFGMITFVFSTILGWCYYGEKACEYLFGQRSVLAYRMLWVIAVMIGSVITLPTVWAFADIANALMALPNLIALVLLSGVVAAETRHYLWNNNLDQDVQESAAEK